MAIQALGDNNFKRYVQKTVQEKLRFIFTQLIRKKVLKHACMFEKKYFKKKSLHDERIPSDGLLRLVC